MLLSAAHRYRRFARRVTAELGALDTSFLGRGRPLGAARVINAVGSGITDLSDLRSYLCLDSGLASRLLRDLEAEGLLITLPDKSDGRRRRVGLTSAGQREFEVYERLSDQKADEVLAQCPDRERLLMAMDLVATVLGRQKISIEEADPRDRHSRSCLERYYAEIDRRFQDGFEVGRSRDPAVKDLLRPRGTFLVALSDELPVGCVALKGNGSSVGEVKRLWVAEEARGMRLGTQLMSALAAVAVELDISVLRLDTNRALTEARELYLKTGWVEVPRFNDDPYADYFFEKYLN